MASAVGNRQWDVDGLPEEARTRSSRVFAEGTQSEMPHLFDLATRGRAPIRLRRLYAWLERSLSPIHALFHTGGATEEERSMSFPCDSYMPPPSYCYYRGIEVLAPQEIVYRWLCQLRVAPYAYDWLDNLGRQSPCQLTPGVERLSPGQRMLVMFRVVEFVENEQITMEGAHYEWFFGKVALTYRVVPSSASSCRIVTKLIAHDARTFVTRLRRDYFPIGELPLMHKQLRTFKSLAERQFLEELASGSRAISVGELVVQPPDRQ